MIAGMATPLGMYHVAQGIPDLRTPGDYTVGLVPRKRKVSKTLRLALVRFETAKICWLLKSHPTFYHL